MSTEKNVSEIAETKTEKAIKNAKEVLPKNHKFNKGKTAKEKLAPLSKINLSEFASQLSKVEIKAKNKKAHLYIYPDDFKPSDINSEKGKKFRSRKRNNLKRITNNILSFAKQSTISKDFAPLQKEVKEFNAFYKESFLVNNFEIASITNINAEKQEYKDLLFALNIVKKVNSSK